MGGVDSAPVRIAAPQLVTAEPGTGILAPGYVTIAGGVVTEVSEGRPPAAPDIDLPDGTLVPGFVDVQVNGYFGADFMTAQADGWAAVVRGLPASGTTAFLPTLMTAPLGQLTETLRGAAALAPRLPFGARVLGVHMEGPFISPQRPGAHNPDWIITPTPAVVDALIEAAGGLLRLLTLAPELPGALAAITQLTDTGVLVSMGHSDATAQQVARGADHGARMVTHLFDAQRGLHHREPGVVGQALTDPRLTSGLIADLHHVGRQACQIAFAAAPGRIAIVTDAAACAGMPPGQYCLGGEPIELPAGDGAPPVRADGTLAGSALRMDAGVANMVAAGVGLAAAVAAASRVPADLVGRPDLGRIVPGSLADLVWLGPDLRAKATWIGGERMVPGAAYAAAGTAAIER